MDEGEGGAQIIAIVGTYLRFAYKTRSEGGSRRGKQVQFATPKLFGVAHGQNQQLYAREKFNITGG